MGDKNDNKTLIEIIRKELENKAYIMCKNYCKYYRECYEERGDDYTEDHIWDKCPIEEFFW